MAARSLGVRVFPSKMAAAAISGFLTGMGGAIYAQYVGYIDPDSILAGSLSILIALPAVLGGVGTLWGPIVGAAVLIPVSELTRSYLGGGGRGVDLMIYGGLIVVVALARPAGLVSLLGVRPRGREPRSWRSTGSARRSAASRPMSRSASRAERGEILGLIGPNGAGKTSLFNSISGEVSPDAGEIRLEGKRISGAGPVACSRAGVARTFQVVRSFDSMTVLENVMVGAFAARDEPARGDAGGRGDAWRSAAWPRGPTRRRICSRRRRSAGSRSPARWRPGRALLLLDEMLTGLTPTEAASGVALVRAVRDQGVTILMVEHVMEVVLPLVDRAVVLNLGRVLMQGSPAGGGAAPRGDPRLSGGSLCCCVLTGSRRAIAG